MKLYVRGYGQEPEPNDVETEAARQVRLSASIIQFAPEAEAWRVSTKAEADVELLMLNRRDFRVGLIDCKYEIEELLDGTFAFLWTNPVQK